MTGKRSPLYYANARKVKAIYRPIIDAGGEPPCVNCWRGVQASQLWDVGHIIDGATGGSDDLSNLGPAHRRCNRRAGGVLGAARRHTSSRRARRLPSWR